MHTMQAKGARQTIKTIITIQLLVLLLAVIITLILGDWRSVYSALIGGGISIIVTFYFANRVFSAGLGSSADKVAKAFYLGAVGKLLLTVVLLSAVLILLPVSALPLLLAYIATLLAYWLALPFTFHASNISVRTP